MLGLSSPPGRRDQWPWCLPWLHPCRSANGSGLTTSRIYLQPARVSMRSFRAPAVLPWFGYHRERLILENPLLSSYRCPCHALLLLARRPEVVSARQCEIDKLDRVRTVTAAQRVSCLSDPRDELAATRRVCLALLNRAIECPRLRHLQGLLRLPGAPGDQRGTRGSQVIARRRIFADRGRRQCGRDAGSRIGGYDVARLVGSRQRVADTGLMAWSRTCGGVQAGRRLGQRCRPGHSKQCDGRNIYITHGDTS